MIQATSLSKIFRNGDAEIIALKDINLRVENGEFLAVIGRSGSGKSTLLYQLGLLDQPTSGEIAIDGVNTALLHEKSRTQLRLLHLGYIFQDYAILPSLSAYENVLLPLLMLGREMHVAKLEAIDALTDVGLQDRMYNLPSQLSGGQQQRVSIARAIAHKPKIIFADEPTANLDTETSHTILSVFVELHKKGQTIVMVTHEEEYARLADRIITLSDGVIISEERPKH